VRYVGIDKTKGGGGRSKNDLILSKTSIKSKIKEFALCR
jgi:hypothetical protein